MFQLWKLVLVCGLLTGTSAFLLENLGKDLNHVVSDLKPVLEEGIETVDNTLDGESTKVMIQWHLGACPLTLCLHYQRLTPGAALYGWFTEKDGWLFSSWFIHLLFFQKHSMLK